MRLRPAADALDAQKVADDTTLDDAIGHHSGGSDEQAEKPRAFTCGYPGAMQLPCMRAERLPARRIPGRRGRRFLLFWPWAGAFKPPPQGCMALQESANATRGAPTLC